MVEGYVGVKFNVGENALQTGNVEDERITEIVRWAGVLSERGFAPENAGNISVREGSGFVITASGSEFSCLTEEDFVLVKKFDLAGFELLSAVGLKLPSSETPLHAAIYEARPDAEAVVHCHALPKGVAETRRKFGYGGRGQAEAVSELMRENDVAIAKGHGVFSVGKTVREAGERILAHCDRGK